MPPSPEILLAVTAALERVENRDAQATQEVLSLTGKLVGWMDVHHASSGNGVEALATELLATDSKTGTALDVVRAVLARMVTAGELELAYGETAAATIARSLDGLSGAAALADLMCARKTGVGELFADDAQLERRLAEMRRGDLP